jgi:hypothetical protein
MWALAHKVKENYNEINEQRKTKLRMELMAEDENARKQIARARNPIQAEPVRRYPYTGISGYYPGPAPERWVEEEPEKPKKIYKYY